MSIQEGFFTLGNFIESSSTISSITAGLFVAVLFSIIYPRYLFWLKRPRLSFIFPFDQKRIIKIKKVEGAAGPEFELGIENSGPVTLEKVYWHIFTKGKKSPKFIYNLEKYRLGEDYFLNTEGQMPKTEKNIEDWWHSSGILEGPMFPGRKIAFPYDIRWEINSPSDYPMYFYFVTEFGVCPDSAREFKLESQFNRIDKYLNKIIIEIE